MDNICASVIWMELTNDEKTVLSQLLDEHLAEVQKSETLRDQQASAIAAEVKYEDFLQQLKEKIQQG